MHYFHWGTFAEEGAFAFSLMIEQFCPHQKWTIIETASWRGRTMVSRRWPKERNE
jgi:hypothetical protein